MPVLIFAAESELDLVRALGARLREDGGEVRCYLEEDDYDLRSIGCKIAVGELDDEANLEAALTGVHTFIPIFADPIGVTSDDQLERVAMIADRASAAAAESKIQQTILPIVGLASADGELGQRFRSIEESFLSKVEPVFVLRTGLLSGPERPLIRVSDEIGEAQISVLSVEEWANAVARADDMENMNGIWELGGAAASFAKIREEQADGFRLHPQMKKVLEQGFTVGSSAEDILIEPRPGRGA